jgi:flagellar basal-body rod protein FlgB
MPQGIEAVTTMALSLALDAASLRQKAFAANIANADTAGFSPLSVNFEAQLKSARRSLQAGGQLDPETLNGVVPTLETAAETSPSGLPVDMSLDVEVARMAQNAGHYETLVKGLTKHFAILSMAVGDGRK